MSTYAVVVNEGEASKLREVGVKITKLFHVSKFNELTQIIESGDTIVVNSISVFGNVNNIYRSMYVLRELQGNFKSLNEPFLNFTNNKPLKQRIHHYLGSLAQFECGIIGHIDSMIHLTINEKQALYQLVYRLFIRVISLTFKEDSILKIRD